VPVVFKGILPDLFREGKGVVTAGEAGRGRNFLRERSARKHDENYMPPAAADAIKQAQSTNEKATHTLIGGSKMIPELGQLALALALCLALAQGLLGLVGAAARRECVDGGDAARGARPVRIRRHRLRLPHLVLRRERFHRRLRRHQLQFRAALQYRIAGVWGGHEGSMLLWVLMLSVWTFGVTLSAATFRRRWVRACSASWAG